MDDTQEKISDLLQKFYKETRRHSTMSGLEKEPSSIALIEIGKPVAHYIFQHNITLSFNLMELLKHVTGFAPPNAPIEEMREQWLNWATENDFR